MNSLPNVPILLLKFRDIYPSYLPFIKVKYLSSTAVEHFFAFGKSFHWRFIYCDMKCNYAVVLSPIEIIAINARKSQCSGSSMYINNYYPLFFILSYLSIFHIYHIFILNFNLKCRLNKLNSRTACQVTCSLKIIWLYTHMNVCIVNLGLSYIYQLWLDIFQSCSLLGTTNNWCPRLY